MYGCPFFVYLTLLPPFRAYCFAVPMRRLVRLVRRVLRRVRLREVVRFLARRARLVLRRRGETLDLVVTVPLVCDDGLINPPLGETGVLL